MLRTKLCLLVAYCWLDLLFNREDGGSTRSSQISAYLTIWCHFLEDSRCRSITDVNETLKRGKLLTAQMTWLHRRLIQPLIFRAYSSKIISLITAISQRLHLFKYFHFVLCAQKEQEIAFSRIRYNKCDFSKRYINIFNITLISTGLFLPVNMVNGKIISVMK
jgi:hypothetical protein